MTADKDTRSANLTPDARVGVWLAVLAALVWPLQAGVLAWAFGALLVAPQGVSALAMSGIFLALTGLRISLDVLSQRWLSEAAEAKIEDLRAKIVATEAASARPSNFGGAGAMAALAVEKLEALRPYMLRYRPARAKAATIPVLILAIALWHSWAVAVIFLMAGPLIPVFMALVGWAAKSASERQMVEIGQLNDLLADRLAAMADLRLIGAGGPLVGGFSEASESLRARTMSVLRIAFLSSTVLELFAALGVAMVAVWVGFSLLGELGWGSWGRELSPAAGIYLLLLAPEFFQPLRDLAAAWHDKAAAEAVQEEIKIWQDEDRVERLGTGDGGGHGPRPALRFNNVSYRGVLYPDLTILPGQTYAITGPSGSGKSNLLRLIAGFDTPEDGRMLLNDIPISQANIDSWRNRLGWMPQAPHFLNRSLRYNIGFGRELDPDVISTAALEHVIATLPRGDMTLLGERGAGLSGGEARRVTLARAIHGKPALILADEPTADLDDQTANAIADGLLNCVNAGTGLVIATHDAKLAARLDNEIRLGPDREAHE